MTFLNRLVLDDKIIGTGAFSTVVIGFDPVSGNKYAVKRVEKNFILSQQEEQRKRLVYTAKREYEMLNVCNHRNIVKFYASGKREQFLLYVLELCSGGELLEAVKNRPFVPLEACRHTMAELFSAVFHLHYEKKKEGKRISIIHRDIKPENIMFSEDFHVRLIDFGTALCCSSSENRAQSEQNEGRAQTLCGTSYYMSPELLQENYTCCASDYWACGCVLFFLLTGRRPFDAPTDYLLMKAILEDEPQFPLSADPEAVDLVKKLLIKTPELRIGMEGVRKHPFFSTVDFRTLHTINMKELWMNETPWKNESSSPICANCRKDFGWRRCKDYCRSCGNYYCAACLVAESTLLLSRYSHPQLICHSCNSRIVSQTFNEGQSVQKNERK